MALPTDPGSHAVETLRCGVHHEPAVLAVIAKRAADAIPVLEEANHCAFHVDGYALVDAMVLAVPR